MRQAIPLLVGFHLLAGQAGTGWRDPSPHQVRFTTVDSSVRLEVLDWGGSGRPVVLLACYLSAHVYDDFAPKLASPQFHVYGISRRGIGASDKPPTGYSVERSAADVLEILDSLRLERPLLVGNSCAGQVLRVFGSTHSDRIGGLVYLDAAEDPTLKLTDYGVPVDPARLPRSIKPAPSPDYTSFGAYRVAQRRDHGVAFPEAELRQLFVANPDGSMGRSLLSPVVRKAIVDDNSNVTPQYATRLPVLAIFRTVALEDVERDSPPRNEDERSALKAHYAFGAAMVSRWERDLLAGVPAARIVELPGANLYMFLSNEADILREVRAFAGALSR